MPPPYKVDRQTDSNSCGYHALANGINLLKRKTIITSNVLIGSSSAPHPVPRIGDSEFNSLLAANGLSFKLTRPMAGAQPMPLSDALRAFGAGGVFIAKAKVTIHDELTGEVSTDYHSIVITDYKSNPDDISKDSWNVLCSACATTKVITAENLTYSFGSGAKGVLKKSYVASIEGCQILEDAATPGGFTSPKNGGFFKDLFSCCCCFGKYAED